MKCFSLSLSHTNTHTRTHARTRAHTHIHNQLGCYAQYFWSSAGPARTVRMTFRRSRVRSLVRGICFIESWSWHNYLRSISESMENSKQKMSRTKMIHCQRKQILFRKQNLFWKCFVRFQKMNRILIPGCFVERFVNENAIISCQCMLRIARTVLLCFLFCFCFCWRVPIWYNWV